MAQLLVRSLDPVTVERLKMRARRHGRSLQAEIKAILESATIYTMEEASAVSAHWHKQLAGAEYGDSARDVSEDRER